MNDSSRDLLLLAAAHLRVGGRRLRALARGEDTALRDWMAHEQASRLATVRRAARESAARLEAAGARLVSIADADYPDGLRHLRDAPAFLCVRGVLPPGGIAVVGSRTPSPIAETFAFELARTAGVPVISGLALGIDAAAHAGALAAETPTLAYVGNGLATVYPREHAALAERIVAGGGALASEYLPEQNVTRWSLVRRDRLQAAHASSCVLVASERTGGAMHTLRFAATLDRPRFALDPSVAQMDGNAVAVADGAALLPRDVGDAIRIIRAREMRGLGEGKRSVQEEEPGVPAFR